MKKKVINLLKEKIKLEREKDKIIFALLNRTLGEIE
jgi:hypothetical protein